MKRSILLFLILGFLSVSAQKKIVINNVEIFNGTQEKTMVGSILIENNLISKIQKDPIAVNNDQDTKVIDGKGKFLMPGLIDAHYHCTMDAIPLQVAMSTDVQYIMAYAVRSAENMLMRGFTSARDMGGNPFSLKRAIDEGMLKGPRIYPSGAMISQTSGHGDFRLSTDVPVHSCGALTYLESVGMAAIADGHDQVLLRTREQLRQGASQIKLAAGGGVASNYDPLDVTEYTSDEVKAAVDAAAGWGTYVTVHAYTPAAMRMAIDAGVKCIEHGHLVDETTAKYMAEKGIWWCLQPFLDDEDANPFPEGSPNRLKQIEMRSGTDTAYDLAKKHKIKTGWGTDCLFDYKLSMREGAQLAKMTRWYTPFEALRMATATNGELLALSGQRNPYPHKLGVIEEGAYADLIIVDGSAIKNIKLVEDPEKNFLLIMKDGVIYKNIME